MKQVRLTPFGRGAIATLLLEGRGIVERLAPFLSLNESKVLASKGSPLYARFGIGNQFEEIVLAVDSPSTIRLHTHGGEAVLAAISSRLADVGIMPIGFEDWLIRSSDPQNPFEAEARAMLSRCRSERTAKIMLDQLSGAFRRELEAGCFDALLSRAFIGLHLVDAFRIAVVGPPNAGKSSLINALLGYERCIVDPTPGTTRDTVSAGIAFDGWPVELIDTAGIRETDDRLERAGLDRTRTVLQDADLILEVVDATTDIRIPDLPERKLVIANKSDLAKSKIRNAFSVSAKTGNGIDLLVEHIVKELVPIPPSPGDGMPFLPGHLVLLTSLRGLSKMS